MAQVSYGTITIIDTNDIERIYLQYCRSTDNQLTNGEVAHQTVSWQEATPPWVNGQYIWQRSVIKKSGVNTLTYGVPVCLTGAQGQTGSSGQSLTATKTQYTHVASNVTITTSNHTSYTWTDNVPEYDSTKPVYWGRITNIYSNPAKTEYLVYKDNGLTDAIAQSVEANTNASDALDKANEAESIAQQTIEDSQGAMGQAASNLNSVIRLWYAKANSTAPAAPTSGITTGSTSTYNAWSTVKPADNSSYQYYFYCDQSRTGGGVYSWSSVTLDTSTLSQYQIGALTAKVKNFWWDSNGAHVASGKNGNEVTTNTISTYGYHALMGLTGISFNYDSAKVVDLNSTTPSLDFYQPPTISGSTVTQGKKTMGLSGNALKFYNTSGTITSTFGDSISLASNGAAITIGSTSTNRYNTYIDTQGLYLRTGTTSYATLNSNGLILSKGGIRAGSPNQSGFIYLSTEPYGSYSINGSSGISNWKEIIGTKFGVTADGTLYASNANISGAITVGEGSNVYTTSEIDSTIEGVDNHLSTIDQDLATKTSIQTEQIEDLLVSFEAVEYPALELNVNIPYTQGGAGIEEVTVVTNGKNLLFDSKEMTTWGVRSGGSISDGIITLIGSSSDWESMFYTPTFGKNIYNGNAYTLSFEYKSTINCDIWLNACGADAPINTTTSSRTKWVQWTPTFNLVSSGGVWKRHSLSRTLSISDLIQDSGNVISGFLQFYARTNNANIQIRNVQLEVGTEATDYEESSNNVIIINLERPIYGGTVNVVDGIITATHSSSGELSEEEIYNISPQKIQLLNGINNIYSNIENVSIVYALITLGALDTLQQIQSNNDILQSQNETITSNLNDTDKLVREYIGNTGYITMINDRIEIGQDKNNNEASTLVLTPEAIKFYGQRSDMGTGTNDKPVAQITQTELEIDKANLQTEMQMGKFLWTIDESSGKLILMYTG